MRLNRLYRLLPLLLLAACDGDPAGANGGDVRLTASVDAFAVAPEVNLQFRVRNEGDRTVWVWDKCGDNFSPWVDRLDGGRWAEILVEGPCFHAVEPPIQLEPGESVQGSIAFYEPGRYRFRVSVTADPDDVQAEVMAREFTIVD